MQYTNTFLILIRSTIATLKPFRVNTISNFFFSSHQSSLPVGYSKTVDMSVNCFPSFKHEVHSWRFLSSISCSQSATIMRRSDLYLTIGSRKGLRFKSNQSVAETADLEAFIGLTKQFWDSNGLKRGKTSWIVVAVTLCDAWLSYCWGGVTNVLVIRCGGLVT